VVVGRELADVLPEAALHQFIGGEHLAPEIVGQEKNRDENPRQQIARHHL